jgi:Protein of unknown function (DUF4007)
MTAGRGKPARGASVTPKSKATRGAAREGRARDLGSAPIGATRKPRRAGKLREADACADEHARSRPTAAASVDSGLRVDLFNNPTDLPPGPAFARHETFAPRPGWVRKGFLAAENDVAFFLSDDSHIRLGVGKNMSRAIRYWCHAMGVLEDVPMPRGRAFGSRQTQFGQQLLAPGGWDEFLEDPASLWLLHWRMVRSSALATAWHYAFTIYPEPEFDLDGLVRSLATFVSAEYPSSRTAESSLKKDASCIARMYGEAPVAAAVTDETIQSPWAELGLLRALPPSPGVRPTYRFETGRKPSLDAAVVAAACLEFAAIVSPGTQTVGLSRLLIDPGSPGMAFKLGEGSLVSYLEEAASRWRGITLADTAGLIQIAFADRPHVLAWRMLDDYYGAASGTVAA